MVRKHYVTQFADDESRVYMKRFYTRYAGKSNDEALQILLQHTRKGRARIATVLRNVNPNGNSKWFNTQMRAQLKNTQFQGSSPMQTLRSIRTSTRSTGSTLTIAAISRASIRSICGC